MNDTIKILIIDDSAEDRETYKRYLKGFTAGNYTVLEKETAEEGMLSFNRETPHCILLDYMLPDMNGLEFLDRIKKKLKDDFIPVILLTGQGNEFIAVKAMKRGASDYLVKDNLTADLFIRTLNHVLERKEREKKLENKLAESERHFRNLIENSSDIITLIDKDGKILYQSPSIRRILGYNEDETIGYSFTKYIHPDDRKKHDEKYSKIIGIPFDERNINEYRIKHRNGEWRHFESMARTVTDEKKQIKMVIINSRDITDRKNTEEALRESRSILQARNEVMVKEFNLAQHTIRQLLPLKAPAVTGLTVAYRYIPLEAIGGDYFSFMPFQEGGLCVFLGDVSGHGVSAALFLTLLKASTDRIWRSQGRHPREFIKELNNDLKGQLSSFFVTAIYGIFNVDDHGTTFTFSKGGHPYPIYYRAASQSVEFVKSEGSLVGIWDDIIVDETMLKLEKGDRIYIYTDGIYEIVNSRKEMLDTDRFIEIVKNNSTRPLNMSLDSILEEIKLFKGDSRMEDDIVLIAFEVH